jgi:Family of unknown function (DUF6152)
VNKIKVSGLALLALLVPGGLLFAHHGTAGFYDQTRKIRVEGVVKQFAWRNPHCGLILVGKDTSGNDVTFNLEMGSPNTLGRMGFTRNSIKPGDRVMAQVHVSFTNPGAGEAEARFIEVNSKLVATPDSVEE